MNFQMIDIIFVIFLIFMAILGYVKGFVTRLYDLVGGIFVLILSYFLAKPLSSLIMIYQYDQQDVFASMIGQMLNQILIFFILLVVLTILKKLLGIAIKPALKGLMDTFSLTSFVDKILGTVLSFIEGIIIAYLVLVFIVVPFTNIGREDLEKTVLAKEVIHLVPSVSEQVLELTEVIHSDNQNNYSRQALMQLMLTAKDMNLLDDEQVITLFQENIENELKQKEITLSSSQKQQIEVLLKKAGYQNKQLESILSKINVSDE